MEAASQAEDTASFPSAGTAADPLRSPKALKWRASQRWWCPSRWRPVSGVKGSRPLRHSDAWAWRCWDSPQKQRSACIHVMPLTGRKNLARKTSHSTQRQQIPSASLASQDWFIMASQSFMESSSLDLKLFFNRPKHPLTKHRVCLTLMNIACYTTSRFVRGGVTWPPATWSCSVRNVNNSMAWIFMKDVRHILWPMQG